MIIKPLKKFCRIKLKVGVDSENVSGTEVGSCIINPMFSPIALI